VTQPYRSLQLTEARARFAQLRVTSYDLRLDLVTDEATFRSVTTIRFTSDGAPTFLDLKPERVNEIRLNGRLVDADLLDRGRLPLEPAEGPNELRVDAVMRFRNDGEGLHRSVDPVDGKHYVYGMCFMDAAPTIFACFDQPDLKAPYTLHVTAPTDWTVVANAPGRQVEPGSWEFDETPPLSTYFVSLIAGPWHVVHERHDGIALGVSARASMAHDLDRELDEVLTVTRQCFDEFHRLFGIRYAFGDYHQAFVPEFNAGAMENPGLVTFRDPYVFTSQVTRGQRILRAVTIAHEMAHQWFGNLTTPRWWDDLWLNESFAEYMGNRVVADVTDFHDAWVHNAYSRRQWGLIADQRPTTHPVAGNGAVDATAALQDFDGISYNKGSSILKQLNATVGDGVFLDGVIEHFTRHRFGNATMDDLFRSWEKAGAGDLGPFRDSWLLTAGPDTLELDRAVGAVVRTPPGEDGGRNHELRAAVARPGEDWRIERLTVDEPLTPFRAAPDEAVVLDPFEDTWALVHVDQVTQDALPSLLPRTPDAHLRAGVWNSVRSSFHNARVSPALALGLIEVAVPVEDNDDALHHTLPWATRKVAPLAGDPRAAFRRIHAACLARVETAAPGSTVQLAAFQGAVESAVDTGLLREWLEGGQPGGLLLDEDLRWQLLVRLAELGATDRDELRASLERAPTAKAGIEHARAVASLPDAEAKAWAWQRFTGAAKASNYELEAVGIGMWRPGQEELTAPYVDRYLAELPGIVTVHAGWVLGDVTQHYFPATSLRPETLTKAQALVDEGELDPTIRRRLLDSVDELGRRIAIREKFGG
jgi:aminopeptidase N